MIHQIPDAILCGILIGLVYSLAATGLTLIWGVMGIINFAHGDLLMLGMFTALLLNTLAAMDPLCSAPLAALCVGVLALIMYRFIIKRIVGASLLVTLLCTFGLAIAIRGAAQFFWGPNYRMVSNSLFSDSTTMWILHLSMPKCIAGVVSGLIAVAIFFLIKKTRTGRAIQAISMDKEAAILRGINADRLYALTFAIGGACAGIAGGMISKFHPVSPHGGMVFVLISFACVAMGGFGSIKGAFWAGIIVGVIQSLGGFLLSPAYEYALVFLLYIITVLIRPKGLFGW